MQDTFIKNTSKRFQELPYYLFRLFLANLNKGSLIKNFHPCLEPQWGVWVTLFKCFIMKSSPFRLELELKT